MRNLPNKFLRDRFGLGSSTRGKTMDEHNRGRSEAEYRAAKPVVKCNAGESFDGFERRMLQRNYDAFKAAIREAVVAMEDANFTSAEIELFKDVVSDAEGDTWRPAIERMEQ